MKGSANSMKLDERHHVEKPLLEQLDGLGWDTIDLTGEPTALAAGVQGEGNTPELRWNK